MDERIPREVLDEPDELDAPQGTGAEGGVQDDLNDDDTEA